MFDVKKTMRDIVHIQCEGSVKDLEQYLQKLYAKANREGRAMASLSKGPDS